MCNPLNEFNRKLISLNTLNQKGTTMFKTLKEAGNAVFDGIDSLNPMISSLNDTHKEMTQVLMANGYDVKKIKDFIDVSRTQFDEWVELEEEVLKRMKAKEEAAAKKKG